MIICCLLPCIISTVHRGPSVSTSGKTRADNIHIADAVVQMIEEGFPDDSPWRALLLATPPLNLKIQDQAAVIVAFVAPMELARVNGDYCTAWSHAIHMAMVMRGIKLSGMRSATYRKRLLAQCKESPPRALTDSEARLLRFADMLSVGLPTPSTDS